MRIDELVETLQSKELELNEASLRLEEMDNDVTTSDHKSFKQWFLANVIGDSTLPQEEVSSPPSNPPENVRDLIVTLVVQWREQIGFYPRGATSAISKAEEKFLQNVTDLVMESHRRATVVEDQIRAARHTISLLERDNSMKSDQLERVTRQLLRYEGRDSLVVAAYDAP
jgi:hypothetical protein